MAKGKRKYVRIKGKAARKRRPPSTRVADLLKDTAPKHVPNRAPSAPNKKG